MTGPSLLHDRVAADVAGRYALERELGRGGTAVVYLARDRKHDRRVALKVLDPDVGHAVGRERFHREIALLARLQHPHILPLHDSGEAAGSLYFVMPYVAGETLRARLDREGALPVSDALRIALEVADALAHAHAQGVVHRDVKPENILLSGYEPTGPTTGGGATPAARAGRGHALVCDFGIARLTGRDTGQPVTAERHTATGLAVGTPAYMAPEQASADRQVDGRADVWALGAVLHEMLTGAVPFADEPSAHAALVRRVSGPPPTLPRAPGAPTAALPRRVVRAVDAVLGRALQPDPMRRYATAGEMAHALQACCDALVPGAGRRTWRELLREPRAAWAAGAVAIVALLGVGAAMRVRAEAVALDPSLVVVLPFAEPAAGPTGAAGARTPLVVDGRATGQLLLDAFARWTDLRLVNATRVNDALARRGGRPPATLDEALAVARSLRAGRLAWGSVGTRGGATEVRGALYDVARPDQTLREHRVVVREELPDLERKFSELGDSLLLGTARSRSSIAGATATQSLNAWRAYDRGHDALARWDLPHADSAFAEAVSLDPAYAPAWLWRAQTLAWMRDPPREAWREAAARAEALAGRLGETDATRARALRALADESYPTARTLFGRLVARDSLDFAAWYGLGDAQARDGVVIRDEASPSRWAFRSSYRGALQAYQRVLQNLPSLHLAFGGSAVQELPKLLAAYPSRLRIGRAVVNGDTVLVAALPSLIGDTLAYVPWPLANHAQVDPRTMPPTLPEAIRRNRQLLLRIAQGWAAAFPRSAEVAEVHASALEALGRLTGGTAGVAGAPDALGVLRAARARPADDGTARRLALAELRVLLKLQRFAAARALADSLLAPRAAGDGVRELAAVASLTGRADETARRLTRAGLESLGSTSDDDEDAAPLPASLAAPIGAFSAYAAIGAPRDSVLAALARVERALDAELPAAERDSVRARYLRWPVSLAVPVVGARALALVRPDGDYLLELQRAWLAGARDSVRARLRTLARSRAALGPAALSADAAYLEAHLHAAVGDTAAAVAALDATLEDLPATSLTLIAQVPNAAGLVRAMALRAALARAGGDAARAARWDGAVAALWGARAAGATDARAAGPRAVP